MIIDGKRTYERIAPDKMLERLLLADNPTEAQIAPIYVRISCEITHQTKVLWKWLSKEDYKNLRRLGTLLGAIVVTGLTIIINWKTIKENLGL